MDVVLEAFSARSNRLRRARTRHGCEDVPMVDQAVAAVLTVSDGVSDGTRADEVRGRRRGDPFARPGSRSGSRALVPDDRGRIEAILRGSPGPTRSS